MFNRAHSFSAFSTETDLEASLYLMICIHVHFNFQTVQLRITVAELLPDNRTPSLGHVIVGASTSGTEVSHWNQMMTSLRKPVAMWHYLRK